MFWIERVSSFGGSFSISHAFFHRIFNFRRCFHLFFLSVFSRNFNKEIFTRRPEFCLLYEKLQKTCKSWKREALTMKYPDLCSTIVKVKESIVICPVRYSNTSFILFSSFLPLCFFQEFQ